jgi:hypothetical protein
VLVAPPQTRQRREQRLELLEEAPAG